jgi:hypothetical protein
MSELLADGQVLGAFFTVALILIPLMFVKDSK